jgi:hypothetical protein
VQLDRQIVAKKQKNLAVQSAAHPTDTNALKNIEVIFPPPPQIAQTIRSQWTWESSMLSNASTESNLYGRQQL